MENQNEINILVNEASAHVNAALDAIEKAETLAVSSRYLYDLLRQSFGNLAVCRHHLNVANDITETIRV